MWTYNTNIGWKPEVIEESMVYNAYTGWNKIPKILKESEYDHVQQHNSGLNAQGEQLKIIESYLKQYILPTPNLSHNEKEIAQGILDAVENIRKTLREGYLDSGYKHDDHDPRNQMDLHGDRYFDDNIERQRSGSTEDEEDEVNTKLEGISERINDLEEYMGDHYNEDTLDHGFWFHPDEPESKDNAPTFNDFFSSHLDQTDYSDWDDRGDDDHGY